MSQRTRKRKKRRLHQIGLPPGTVIVDPENGDLKIRVVRYGPQKLEELEVTVETLAAELGKAPVTWVDISGHGDAAKIQRLGQILGIHVLALEDVVNSFQRSKVESYGDDLFIIARMIDESHQLDTCLETEQLAMMLRHGLLVTFQEKHGDCFDPVRLRLRSNGPRLRAKNSDYLAYALLDAIVDRYLVLVERFRTQLEEVEDLLLAMNGGFDINRLYHIRRDIVHIGRAAAPLRDMVGSLLRNQFETQIKPDTQVYLRDCHDHALRVVDWAEGYRDFASSLMEVHLSTVGHKTNEAMKVLTIISTIFIPLSFIAGLYGMNFDPQSSPFNMPELRSPIGYPAVLAVMFGVGVTLLWLFKRKGWL